jgi:uncharacterized membrane protein HdeD (DUF308 family)
MADVKVIDIGGTIAEHRGWFTFLGLALVAAGVLAIIFPLAGGLVVESWVAIACAVAGVAQCVHAFGTRGWQDFLLGLLIGVLYLVTAALLLTNPVRGVLTLTALLSVLLVAEGVIQVIMAFRIRPVSGWGFLAASGVLGAVLGTMIWMQLPSSAVWVLGMFLGVNLITSGLAFTALARSAQPMPGTGSGSV